MAKKSSGQIFIPTLLVLVVGLTIGLSLASRVITDIKISRQMEESSRALAAAEAGIEETLRTGVAAPGTFSDAGGTYEVKYAVTKGTVGGTSNPFSFGQIAQDDTQTVWFIGHKDTGDFDYSETYDAPSIDVCWAETSPAAAIEVIIYYNESGKIKVWRAAFDPEEPSRGNNFSSVDAADGGNCGNFNLKYRKTVAFNAITGTKIAMRLRLMYNTQPALLAVAPDSSRKLPTQGEEIVSTGTLTIGNVTRKVRVFTSYKTLPEIFDYVLFSGGSLKKL